MFSVFSAVSQILPYKLIRNSWHWNGLFCILNPSIWLYWVKLRSGNAIQIWANEFCFKDLSLRLWMKRPQFCWDVHLQLCLRSAWESWLSEEGKFIFSKFSKIQLSLNEAPERKSQQIQQCWNLSGTASLKLIMWQLISAFNHLVSFIKFFKEFSKYA